MEEAKAPEKDPIAPATESSFRHFAQIDNNLHVDWAAVAK